MKADQPPFPASLDGRTLEPADAALSARIMLDLTGPGGGLFLLSARDGRLAVEEVGDRTSASDLQVLSSASDLRSILDGDDDAQLALRTGRLRMRGDMTLALRLRALLTTN